VKSKFTILFLFVVQFTYGQSFLGLKPLNDTIPDDKSGFFFLPLLYYTPDTRLAYGGAGVYYFKVPPKNEDQQKTRASYLQFLADYTQNKQLDIWGQWNVFTRNEDYLLKGEIRYRNFPDRFFGIGNESLKENTERYEYDLVKITALALKKVSSNVFVGIDYLFEYEYNFKRTEGGLLDAGHIRGYDGGRGSAFGVVGVYDTRDNIINAYKGKFAEVSSYFFDRSFGSTFEYINLNATYRQYWQLKPKHVLASQTIMRFNFGDVPFLDMATAGGDDILRGYPKNRFRDRHFAATQVEYRFPLFWRFGGVAFTGVGDVFNSLDDVKAHTLKYSVGTGIRFVVNPAERINVRFDYGRGREGGYIYFIVTEAF
jgi:hypothetical protein